MAGETGNKTKTVWENETAGDKKEGLGAVEKIMISVVVVAVLIVAINWAIRTENKPIPQDRIEVSASFLSGLEVLKTRDSTYLNFCDDKEGEKIVAQLLIVKVKKGEKNE